MITGLNVVIFLKSHAGLAGTAERVFGALRTPYEAASADDWGGEHFRAAGLGFDAVLFSNSGDLLDPEFRDYPFGLDLTARFWCVDLDQVDLEGPLSEYYARQLAFELNEETATEILLETTEEAEILEIRAFRRNPQYRLDQAPTTPKVFVIETRQVEVPFDEADVWEEGEEEEDFGTELAEEPEEEEV
jgi:hypothetical protein